MITINRERFLRDLHSLADIGRLPLEEGGGRDRRAFSQSEREARQLFTSLAKQAGLVSHTDNAGNLSARTTDASQNAPILLFGSHMDTVPNGGPYDGALGVIAALEAVRVLKETYQELPVLLECIAFTDEEGRYCGLTGSQLYAGTYSREATERFYDAAMRYPDDVHAMSEFLPAPFTVDNLLQSDRSSENLLAFVELHIEQGPRLEHEQKTIGVVDAIFGRASCDITFSGRSDHAGTTPMYLRRDALASAAHFITQMNEFVTRECAGAVITFGDVRVRPGADNVVPREAVVLVEYRANSSAILDRIDSQMHHVLEQLVEHSTVTAKVQNAHRLEPRQMDASIQQAIRASCDELGYSHMNISSGALHDAHSLAAIAPAAMIFVPSIGGRSHCPEEDTVESDLIAGANVLLNTLDRIMRSYQSTLAG